MKGSMYAMKFIDRWWVVEFPRGLPISGPYDDEFDAYAWIMRGYVYES